MKNTAKWKDRTKIVNDLIMQIRNILNELCSDSDEMQNTNEKLILSRCLDELIVESVRLSQNRLL